MSPDPDAAIPGPLDPGSNRLPDTKTTLGDSQTDPHLTSLVRRRAERSEPSSVTYSRPNLRRSSFSQVQFWVLLALFLAVQLGTALFYFLQIKPHLAKSPALPATPGASNSSSSAENSPLQDSTLTQIATASAQIQELQKQLDSIRSVQSRQEEAVESLADRFVEAQATGRPPQSPTVSTPSAAGIDSRELDPSAPEPFTSSTGSAELRLIKERNRLTSYADEAISTGNRRTLTLIIDAMRDPDRATLFHAAQAEYYRVLVHYQMLSRIDPSYKLALNELFPGEKLRDEADLRTPQIIGLLQDHTQDWRARLRAAYLLTGRRTPEVGDALVAALRDDPNLDVAKEAQLSFEGTFGRRFLLFDVSGIEAWWQTQATVRSSLGSESPPPAAKPADR